MNEQEYTKIVKIWVKLSQALSTFSSPEEDFPKGRENFLEMKLREAYTIIDQMVRKGKEA